MVKLADNLRENDIEKIKYLFSDIGEAVIEKATAIQLIRILEIHGKVGADNLISFKDVLKIIGRPDLLKILNGGKLPILVSIILTLILCNKK